MKLFTWNKKKKNNIHFKFTKKEYSEGIDPNTPIIVSQDLFGLMVEIDRALRAYGIPSIYFVSNVMSAKTKNEEIKIMIEAPQTLQSKLLENMGPGGTDL